MESLYKSSFRIQLVVKTKPRRDIFPLGLYIYRLFIFHFIFPHDHKTFFSNFQILRSLTDTYFNMHILILINQIIYLRQQFYIITTICTVLLLIPNFFAVCRTVAFVSIM